MGISNFIDLDYVAGVIRYPYRTARIADEDVVITIKRNIEDIKDFEKKLAEATHMDIGNHTCYELLSVSGNSKDSLYIMFTDNEMRIGTNIIVSEQA